MYQSLRPPPTISDSDNKDNNLSNTNTNAGKRYYVCKVNNHPIHYLTHRPKHISIPNPPHQVYTSINNQQNNIIDDQQNYMTQYTAKNTLVEDIFFYLLVLTCLVLAILISLYVILVYIFPFADINTFKKFHLDQLDNIIHVGLWFGTFSFALSGLIYLLAVGFHVHNRRLRSVQYVCISIMLISSICCLLQALGFGHIIIKNHVVFYLRYVDYFVNFPIMLLGVSILTGQVNIDILFSIILAAFTPLCLLIGSLIQVTIYKLIFFGLAMMLYCTLLNEIYQQYRLENQTRYLQVLRGNILFETIPIFIGLYLLNVMIVWLMSELLFVMDPNIEITAIALIDVIVKNAICVLLIISAADSQTELDKQKWLRDFHIEPLAEEKPTPQTPLSLTSIKRSNTDSKIVKNNYGSIDDINANTEGYRRDAKLITTEAFLTGFGVSVLPVPKSAPSQDIV